MSHSKCLLCNCPIWSIYKGPCCSETCANLLSKKLELNLTTESDINADSISHKSIKALAKNICSEMEDLLLETIEGEIEQVRLKARMEALNEAAALCDKKELELFQCQSSSQTMATLIRELEPEIARTMRCANCTCYKKLHDNEDGSCSAGAHSWSCDCSEFVQSLSDANKPLKTQSPSEIINSSEVISHQKTQGSGLALYNTHSWGPWRNWKDADNRVRTCLTCNYIIGEGYENQCHSSCNDWPSKESG